MRTLNAAAFKVDLDTEATPQSPAPAPAPDSPTDDYVWNIEIWQIALIIFMVLFGLCVLGVAFIPTTR